MSISKTEVEMDKKLDRHTMFKLWWFDRYVLHAGQANYDYIEDYHTVKPLIDAYNQLMKLDFMSSDIEVELMDKLSKFTPKGMNVDVCDLKIILKALQTDYFIRFGKSICIENIPEVTFSSGIKVFKNCATEFVNNCNCDYRYDAKPAIWRDYSDSTIKKIEEGARMEAFVDRTFRDNGIDIGFYYDPDGQRIGESEKGIEIKCDARSVETGNYYIEVEERYKINGVYIPFVPSGIFKTDNTKYWIIGVPEKYYIVEKATLIAEVLNIDPNSFEWQDGKKYVVGKTSKAVIFKEKKLAEIAVSSNIAEFCKLLNM